MTHPARKAFLTATTATLPEVNKMTMVLMIILAFFWTADNQRCLSVSRLVLPLTCSKLAIIYVALHFVLDSK